MEKKLLVLGFGLFLILISFIGSTPPQFLVFEGKVIVDGRYSLPEGSLVNFTVNGDELGHAYTDNRGFYGPVMLQGFDEFYGEKINIFVNGTEVEEEVYYIYPQNISLNLSVKTDETLRVSDYSPSEDSIKYKKNYSFEFLTKSGYDDIVNHTWFLDGEKVKEFSGQRFSSYEFSREDKDNSKHKVIVIASNDYFSVSNKWILEGKESKDETDEDDEPDSPDWECGEWSSCIKGVKIRICEDLNNLEGDKMEKEDCPSYSSEDKKKDIVKNNTREKIFLNQSLQKTKESFFKRLTGSFTFNKSDSEDLPYAITIIVVLALAVVFLKRIKKSGK